MISGATSRNRTCDLRIRNSKTTLELLASWQKTPVISIQFSSIQSFSIRFSLKKCEHFVNMLAAGEAFDLLKANCDGIWVAASDFIN